MRQTYAAVLFDLDGTLVDSAPDLMAAMNRLLARHARPVVEPVAFRAVVSKGSRAMLAIAFPDIEVAAREALLPEFLALYADDIAGLTRTFEGVPELLALLQAQAVPWAIVTNKPVALAQAVLATMPWADACATLVGGDTLAVKKPDPAPLRLACATLGVQPEQCIYVGDDERDILAARACGMPSVAALWGYRDAGDDPACWGADMLAASPRELLQSVLPGCVCS